MILKQGLTRESFWSVMKDKYPLQMQFFCDWIDDYKKAVGWEHLFKGGKQFKFHDLPYSMQQGVWIEFLNQLITIPDIEVANLLAYSLEDSIYECFKTLRKSDWSSQQIEHN